MGRCVYITLYSEHTKCTTFSQKLKLHKASDDELILNFCASGNWIMMMWMVSLTLQMKIHLQTSALANGLWCSVKWTLVASDEIQVNVMQKSVMYWKWPNVVDIYCKRADAIKQID